MAPHRSLGSESSNSYLEGIAAFGHKEDFCSGGCIHSPLLICMFEGETINFDMTWGPPLKTNALDGSAVVSSIVFPLLNCFVLGKSICTLDVDFVIGGLRLVVVS